jgi:hypothetical protein
VQELVCRLNPLVRDSADRLLPKHLNPGEYEMTTAAKKFVDPCTVKETHVSAIEREMSISIERFSNRLPQVTGGVLSEDSTALGHFKLRSSAGLISITYEKMNNRYIGSLAIPVNKIKLDFKHYDTSQVESFMRQFDRAYLKLGG